MSLSANNTIEVITAKSSRGLRNKLRFINGPFGIKQIYFDSKSGEHVAWINPDRPFTKKFLSLIDRVEKEVSQ